jgi:Fe-S-cluster containining protein
VRYQHEPGECRMMRSIPVNPCAACTTNQHCCSRLSGLILSQKEFDALFKGHAEGLTVRQVNKVVIVSAKYGGACPHWANEGCRIYQDRPMDCRIFPYVLTRVIEKRNKVKIIFHTRTDCPQKDILYALLSEAAAKALVMEFGEKIFGEAKAIIVERENGLFSQLRIRIETAISRRRFK